MGPGLKTVTDGKFIRGGRPFGEKEELRIKFGDVDASGNQTPGDPRVREW
jgi:hypothetical protein